MKTELTVSSPSSLTLGQVLVSFNEQGEIDIISSSPHPHHTSNKNVCQELFLVMPDGLEPSQRAYETHVRTVRCHRNLEVWVRFELTTLRICNPIPWATRAPHRIKKPS